MPIDLTKLPVGTRLKTRDGRSARLLANDIVDSLYTCAVAVLVDGAGEMIETVQPTGHLGYQNEEQPSDIVGIERPKHRVRVLVFQPTNGEIPWAVAVHEAQDTFGSQAEDIATFSSNLIVADRIVEIEEASDVP